MKELQNIKKAAAENAERAYELMLRHWRPRRPKRRTDATKGNDYNGCVTALTTAVSVRSRLGRVLKP